MNAEFGIRASASGLLLVIGLYCMCQVQEAGEKVFAPEGDGQRAVEVVLRKCQVAIDPGRGGDETGYEGNGACEKVLTLALARQVARQLRRSGVQVILIREEDVTLPPQERCRIAKAAGATVMLCLKLSAYSPAADVAGVETHVCAHPLENDHARLRRLLHVDGKTKLRDGRSVLLARMLRHCVCRETSQSDRGLRQTHLEVLRLAPCPAVALSFGFVSNAPEAHFIATPEYQEEAGRAIAAALCHYLLATSVNSWHGISVADEHGNPDEDLPDEDLLEEEKEGR